MDLYRQDHRKDRTRMKWVQLFLQSMVFIYALILGLPFFALGSLSSLMVYAFRAGYSSVATLFNALGLYQEDER